MPTDQPYQYAASFICASGAGGPDGTTGGGHGTRINILNPHSREIRFAKRISLRGPGQSPGNVSEWIRDSLGPYETLSVTCQQIPAEFPFESAKGAPTPKFTFFEGFLIVECDVSLVVTAIYTVAGVSGEVLSVHVEQINERYKGRAKKPKSKSKRKKSRR
jgi:hypothetical protein